MKMTRTIIILIVLLGLLLNCRENKMSNNGQVNDMNANQMQTSDNNYTIKYYGGSSGYSLPLKPVEEITKEEALKRLAYYIAYYNSNDLIIKFEKYFNKELFFSFDYQYYDNGKLKEGRGTDADGKLNVQKFDRNGKYIKKP